ncbi:MATE efflux family protein, partial [Vibrio parahaemolyticus EKP-028]|jgi:UV excision repair protein RAD23
LVN